MSNTNEYNTVELALELHADAIISHAELEARLSALGQEQGIDLSQEHFTSAEVNWFRFLNG